MGEGFGHFGLAVNDVAATVEAVRAAGGKVRRSKVNQHGILIIIDDGFGLFVIDGVNRSGECHISNGNAAV